MAFKEKGNALVRVHNIFPQVVSQGREYGWKKSWEKERERQNTYSLELEGNELETLVLETLGDLTNETTLDTIGLDLDD